MSRTWYISRTPIAFFVPYPNRPGQGKWISLGDEIPEWISQNFLQYLIGSGQVAESLRAGGSSEKLTAAP